MSIFIGKYAGYNASRCNYCIVVGSDSTTKNMKDGDMQWYVDWDFYYLQDFPQIKKLLRDYYDNVILKKKDTKYGRVGLYFDISAIVNCRHYIFMVTMLGCEGEPCNTATCQSCGKQWKTY